MPSAVTIQRCHEHVCVAKEKNVNMSQKHPKKLPNMCYYYCVRRQSLMPTLWSKSEFRSTVLEITFQALGQPSWLLGYHQEFCRRILLESGCALQEWNLSTREKVFMFESKIKWRESKDLHQTCIILAHSAHILSQTYSFIPCESKGINKKKWLTTRWFH